MKYENFEKAQYVKHRIDKLIKAKKDLEKMLKEHPNGDSDFGAFANTPKMIPGQHDEDELVAFDNRLHEQRIPLTAY